MMYQEQSRAYSLCSLRDTKIGFALSYERKDIPRAALAVLINTKTYAPRRLVSRVKPY
ncbi:hypothetical protein VPHD530_0009 [Vibrio phage D530]